MCDIDVADGECDFDKRWPRCRRRRNGSSSTTRTCRRCWSRRCWPTEDRKFFDHSGIDPVGIGRWSATWSGDSQSQQGGSTITQQYVKTVVPDLGAVPRPQAQGGRPGGQARGRAGQARDPHPVPERDLLRSRRLRRRGRRRGSTSGSASTNLQLHQAAYLAGLIRSPETRGRVQDPEEATRRRGHRARRHGRGGLHHRRARRRPPAAVPWVCGARRGRRHARRR